MLSGIFAFYLKYLATLPPLLAGIILFSRFNKGLRWLFYFVCFGTVMQLASRIVVMLGHVNVPMMHLYVPLKFLFFSIFYAFYLDGFLSRRVIYAVAALFITFSVINTIFIQSLFEYNSYVRAIGSLLLSVYCIVYFLKVMSDMQIKKPSREPMVWINTGALFYFSGSFFVFILSNLILNHSREWSLVAWRINSILMTMFYLSMAVGFVMTRKKQQVKPGR